MTEPIIPFADEAETPPVIPFIDAVSSLSLTNPEQNVKPLQDVGLLQAPKPGEEDPLALTLQKKVAQVVPSIKASTGGILQAVGETLQAPDIGPDGRIITEGQETKNAIREWARGVSQYGIDLRKRAQGEAAQLEPNIEQGTAKAFLGDVAGTTARMVPSIIGGALTGGATANPAIGANVGLAIMFPDLFGEAYGKARDKKLDPDRALLDATVSAAQNTVLEKVPLHFIFKGGNRLLPTILKGAGAEGLTEYVQSTFDELIDQGVLHGDMSLEEAYDTLMDPKVQKDLLYQAAVGATVGGLFGAGAHAAGVTNPAMTPPDTIAVDPVDFERAKQMMALRERMFVQNAAPPQEPTNVIDFKTSLDDKFAEEWAERVKQRIAEQNEFQRVKVQERAGEFLYEVGDRVEMLNPYTGQLDLVVISSKFVNPDNDEISYYVDRPRDNANGIRTPQTDITKKFTGPTVVQAKAPDWNALIPDEGKEINAAVAEQLIMGFTDDKNTRLAPFVHPEFEQQFWDAFKAREHVYGEKVDPTLRVAGFDRVENQTRWPAGTADKIYNAVSAWKQRFAPQLKIAITDGSPEIIAHYLTGRSQPRLVRTLADSVGLVYRRSDGTYSIALTSSLSSAMFDVSGSLNEKQLFGTLSHEFGHALAFDMLARSPLSVQQAVRDSYREWHKQTYTAPLAELLEGKYTESSANLWLMYYTGKYGPDVTTQPVYALLQKHGRNIAREVEYLLSFDEWLADQYARYAAHPKQGLSIAERFFVRVAEMLKRFFSSLSDVTRFSSSDGYVRFLKWASEKRFSSMMEANNPGVKVAKNYQSLSSFIPNLPYAVKNMWKHGGEIDKFNKVMEQLYTVRQIAQLNPHIVGLQEFMAGLEAMSVTKNQLLHRAEERLVEMSNLGKTRLNNVGRFLLEETVEGKFLDLTDPQVLKQYGLDVQAIEVIQKIKTDFANILNEMERILSADIIARYMNEPVRMQQEANKLHTQMQRMRSVPYFPLARFGNYSVVVRAGQDMVIDGRAFKKDSVIDMRTFKNETEQKVGHKEALDDYKGQDVRVGMDYIEDVAFEFQGIPPQVFDALEGELNLTSRQVEALQQYRTENAPGRSFLKHLKRRNKTFGFSEDAERAYGDYMLRASNHLARISHYKRLNAAKTDVAQSATDIQYAGGDATKRRRIHEYMSETYDYVMNPGNEWASLRSLAFQWHLGLNIKSAFVQLTQIPLSTYPMLSHDYGDVKATAAITKAMKGAYDVWKNPAALSPAQQQALKLAEEAGVVNQSFATMVAGISEGHALQRVVPGSRGAKMLRDGAYLTSWMFQKMELLNRRITFLAAFELAQQSGKPFSTAYEYAKNAVQDTQGEYSRSFRPKLFRGKKGILFIFKSYQQFMLFNFLHSRARVRYLAMMGLMGGILGMPFAEDLFDLLDSVLSWGDKKWDTRKEIREFLGELTSKPDLIMHGLSRESFGLAGLAHAIGVPFPRIDLSGSLSMGRVIPGFEGVMRPGTLNERLERGATDAAGAGIAIPLQIASTILEYDRNPDKARLMERAIPPAIKNAARAFRWGTEGGEKDARGALRVPMSWQDTEQRAEIIASALGFQPTRLQVQREQEQMFKRHAEFYMLRQQLLLQDFAYAYALKDREGLADVRRAISEYNNAVPTPALRITGEVLRKSVKDRMRNIQKLQKGIPLEGKKYTGLYREIDRLFPDEDIEMQLLRNQGLAPALPFVDEE